MMPKYTEDFKNLFVSRCMNDSFRRVWILVEKYMTQQLCYSNKSSSLNIIIESIFFSVCFGERIQLTPTVGEFSVGGHYKSLFRELLHLYLFILFQFDPIWHWRSFIGHQIWPLYSRLPYFSWVLAGVVFCVMSWRWIT